MFTAVSVFSAAGFIAWSHAHTIGYPASSSQVCKGRGNPRCRAAKGKDRRLLIPLWLGPASQVPIGSNSFRCCEGTSSSGIAGLLRVRPSSPSLEWTADVTAARLSAARLRCLRTLTLLERVWFRLEGIGVGPHFPSCHSYKQVIRTSILYKASHVRPSIFVLSVFRSKPVILQCTVRAHLN